MIPVQACVPATIAEVLRRQPLSPAKVTFAWRVVVGPAMARATEVAFEARGALRVTAADRHWTREIEAARPLILARLAELLGPGVVRTMPVRCPAGADRAERGTRGRRPHGDPRPEGS